MPRTRRGRRSTALRPLPEEVVPVLEGWAEPPDRQQLPVVARGQAERSRLYRAWTHGMVGGGVSLHAASARIQHTTIALNVGAGISCQGSTSPAPAEVSSSIVWGNFGGALEVESQAAVQVSHSCLHVGEVAGDVIVDPSTIHEDPLFCGWLSADEASVASQEEL